MKRNEKYKKIKSDLIDSIPTSWCLKKVKFIANIYNGDSLNDEFKAKFESDNYSHLAYISSKDIHIETSKINYENGLRIPKDFGKFKIAKEKSTLLCIEGGSAGKKIAFTNQDVFFVNKLACFDAFSSTDSKFIFYSIKANIFQKQFSNSITGLIGGVSLSILKNFYITFPPLSEQHQIAAFLDYKTALIDEIIAKKERLIELLQAKRQATINEVVTGKKVWNAASQTWEAPAKVKDSGVEWLGEIPEEWEVVKLKYLVTMKSGNFISADLIEQIGEYPVFGGNGIRGYHSEFTHDGFFPLIGRQGALCGNINYAKGKFWATEHAVVVEAKKEIDLYWLGELLRIMNLNQYSIASAQPGLSVERILNLHVPLPKESNQILISHFIKNFEKTTDVLVSKLHTQIQSLKSYRQSLISEAVTGKIDVRDWEAPKENILFDN